ncbi:hypothetical protein [Williamsia sp.]|uniref:hypothetical protein n=1 Tax=Williamsia sp. TaxID=1872085 RepID=UPI002F9350E3
MSSASPAASLGCAVGLGSNALRLLLWTRHTVVPALQCAAMSRPEQAPGRWF